MNERPTDAKGFRAINKKIVAEFRANAGVVGGLLAGKDVLLLTTTGVKSGEPRVTPLFYFMIDGKMIVVGSYRGSDSDPLWVRNLRAYPYVQIEVGATSYKAIARELPIAERDDLYPRVVEVAPDYGGYEAKTSRIIPLYELQRT